MHSFAPVENGYARLYSRGVSKEVPLFTLGDVLYAKHGSGYIKLKASKNTSVPSVRWDDFYIGSGSCEMTPFNIIYSPPSAVKAKPKRKPKLVAAE